MHPFHTSEASTASIRQLSFHLLFRPEFMRDHVLRGSVLENYGRFWIKAWGLSQEEVRFWEIWIMPNNWSVTYYTYVKPYKQGSSQQRDTSFLPTPNPKPYIPLHNNLLENPYAPLNLPLLQGDLETLGLLFLGVGNSSLDTCIMS